MNHDNLARLVGVTYQLMPPSGSLEPGISMAQISYRAVLVFEVEGGADGPFNISVPVDTKHVKQNDLIRVGRAELHRVFAQLAETTKGWSMS